MKVFWLLITALLLAASPLSLALAQDADAPCDLVYFFDAWAAATAPGAPTGAVYGLLVNLSDQPDTLVSASSDAAEATELHEMSMGENDVMQMRPVEGGIVVAPNGFTELQPGGYHIMLVNLTAPLEAGSSIDLTLNFEHAGEVTIALPVRERMAMDESMASETATPDMGMAESGSMNMAWEPPCAGIHVVGAWARPSIPGASTSAAYGLLLNLTDSDETLVSAATGVALASELHEMSMGENDVMQMRPIEGGIDIPAGGTARLQPGGMHVMLIGLDGDLAAGTMLDLTLTFAESGVMHLSIPVKAPDEDGMTMGGM